MMRKKSSANLSLISRRLRDRQGVTLVELLVAMAIVAILGVVAVQIYTTTADVVTQTQAKNQQQLIVDGVLDIASSELRYATDMVVGDSAIDGYDTLTCADSVLILNGAQLLDITLVVDQTVELTFTTVAGEQTVQVDIVVSDQYDNVTSGSITVKLLNYELMEQTLAQTASGSSVSYQVL